MVGTIRNSIFRGRLWKDVEDGEYTPVTSERATGCICVLQLSSLNHLLREEIMGFVTWRQLKKDSECSPKYLVMWRARLLRWLQKVTWNPTTSGLLLTSTWHLHWLAIINTSNSYTLGCDMKREIKRDTYPPSKILILTGSPLLVTRASSSDFPLLSSSFSALVISFRPSLERSEGKWTYLPKRAKQSLITYKITLQAPQTKHCRLPQKEPATYHTRCSWQLSAVIRKTSQEMGPLCLDLQLSWICYIYSDHLQAGNVLKPPPAARCQLEHRGTKKCGGLGSLWACGRAVGPWSQTVLG